MPLFVNTWMLAGLLLAAAPVIIHLFFRLRRRRVVFPPLRFLRKTQTVQNARLKLRDLLLLICRLAAIVCLALAFARPYFLGQELEAGIESGAVDLILLVDNSASMSYKPDQLSRLDAAREQALTLIGQRQAGDRVGVLEVTRPNDPAQRLDSVLTRARTAVQTLPQRFSRDQPLGALITACNSFSDDPEFKRTHRVVYLGDLQASRWPAAELERQIAPLVEKYRVEIQLIDLAGAPPNPIETPSAATTPPPPSANTLVTAIDFNLAGFVPGQPAPVTATVHRFDDKPVAVLPVQLTVLGQTSLTPFLGSLNMAGSGDARLTLQPVFTAPGWQAVRLELLARDPLPADNVAYAVARLTERPAVLVVEGAADEPAVREDETRAQSYFVAQALRVNLQEQGRDLDVHVVPPSGLTNLVLANHGGVVLCGVSALAAQQVQALEQFTARGGEVLLFAARVQPGTPGKLSPPEDRTALAFYNTAFYKNGLGLIGVRLDPPSNGATTADGGPQISQLHHWNRDSDLFAPFSADPNGDPTGFSLYARMAVNAEDLQSLTARSTAPPAAHPLGKTPPGTNPPSDGDGATGAPADDDPGRAGAQVVAAISPTEPFILDRRFGRGRVVTVFAAARPEWTNWVRKRNFLPVIRQWGRRLEPSRDPAAAGAPPIALTTRYEAGSQPTVAQVIGEPPPAPGAPAAALHPGADRYTLQRPDPTNPFQPAGALTPALRVENLSLESTLDLDTPGIYYLSVSQPQAPGGGDSLLLPIAVSIDPAEGILQPAAAGGLLAAMAPRLPNDPATHTITAESSAAAKQSSRWWIWLAAAVAVFLLIEQLIRDGRVWRAPASAPATAEPAAVLAPETARR